MKGPKKPSHSEKPGSGFFPDPSALLVHPDPDGVVAIEGELSVERLIEAYRLGIFPWPTQVILRRGRPAVNVLLWFCPPERAVLDYSCLHIPRSLARARRRAQESGNLSFSWNRDFRGVMEACASTPRPGAPGTWITPEMKSAYGKLFDAGHAWSVECWNDQNELVGGVYGVEVDGIVSAESMFHRVDDASKLCLLFLMEALHERGIDWIDIQMLTPHLEKLGARALSRAEYLQLLEERRRSELM